MSRSFKQNGSNSSEESLNDSDQVPDQVQLYKNKKFTQKSSVGTQSERNPLDDRRTRSTLDSRELGVEVSPLVDLTRVDRPHSVNCITAKRQTVDVEREFQRQTSYEEPAVSWRNIKRSTASGASGSQGGTYRHSPVSGPSTSMTIFQVCFFEKKKSIMFVRHNNINKNVSFPRVQECHQLKLKVQLYFGAAKTATFLGVLGTLSGLKIRYFEYLDFSSCSISRVFF